MSTVGAYIVSGAFCFSFVSKILYWTDTVKSMESILLNRTLGIAAATFVILIEIILAAALFVQKYWKYAGIFSAVLLTIFTFIAFWAKSSGRITECPCLGNFFGGEIGIKFFIRNLILTVMSLMWAGFPDYLSTKINEKVLIKENTR